jgi:hypothetical protein
MTLDEGGPRKVSAASRSFVQYATVVNDTLYPYSRYIVLHGCISCLLYVNVNVQNRNEWLLPWFLPESITTL